MFSGRWKLVKWPKCGFRFLASEQVRWAWDNNKSWKARQLTSIMATLDHCWHWDHAVAIWENYRLCGPEKTNDQKILDFRCLKRLSVDIVATRTRKCDLDPTYWFWSVLPLEQHKGLGGNEDKTPSGLCFPVDTELSGLRCRAAKALTHGHTQHWACALHLVFNRDWDNDRIIRKDSSAEQRNLACGASRALCQRITTLASFEHKSTRWFQVLPVFCGEHDRLNGQCSDNKACHPFVPRKGYYLEDEQRQLVKTPGITWNPIVTFEHPPNLRQGMPLTLQPIEFLACNVPSLNVSGSSRSSRDWNLLPLRAFFGHS